MADIDLTIRRFPDASLALRIELPGTKALLGEALVSIDPTQLLGLSADSAAYGAALTAMVFPAALREAWGRARGTGPVHLRIVIDDVRAPLVGALHALRWELLRDPLTGAPLAQREGDSLARQVLLDRADELEVAAPPTRAALRALVAVAGPADGQQRFGLAPVAVPAEAQRAMAALGEIKADLLAEAPALATLENIAAGLREGAQLLYLVCHGRQTPQGTTLYLVGDENTAAPISGDALEAAIKGLEPRRRPLLAVLIACESASQESAPLASVGPLLARAGVPAVVAMQAPISMAAAARLTARFLGELARDGRIAPALAAARKELGAEWWVPALWLRGERLWDDGAHEADPLAILNALPLDNIPDPAPLPPGSRMPFSRNPLFVGRADDLRWLAATLKGGATAAIGQVAAATGLGGIGKTNLATEFAHRYGQFFAGGVFWLSFAEPAGVAAEIAACGQAEALGLYGEADELSQDEQVALVLRAWQQPTPRLIVLDNCEDEELLAAWRPRIGGGCRVLLTSRSGEWDSALGVVVHRLGTLDRAESVALLRSLRANLSESEADTIAEVLGDLPLALHLAGSFLRAYPKEQPTSYLARLDSALLNHPSLAGRGSRQSPTDHDRDIARTFALSYDRLNAEDSCDTDARRLLACAACLAPGEPIPADLLQATLGRDLADETARLDAQDALSRLLALGMLDQEQGEALLLHRLLHAFVSEVADDPEAQGAVEDALNSAAYQLNNTGYPAAMQPIAAHLRYATERTAGRDDERAANLCGNLAYHLDKLGDYAAARPLFEHTLAIYEQVLGPDHPTTAISLNNLAALHYATGNYVTARPLYERALVIREQVLGPSHPATATTLNNLAALHYAVGEYDAARSLLEHALRIHEQVLGPSHPDTAQSLSNLALLLRSTGDYTAARPLLERALTIREQALGPSHPDTATTLNNLALLLRSTGDYAAARPLYERALAIREQALGPSHPDIAQSLNNLAGPLLAVGDYAAARPLLDHALAIHEQTLGPDHPSTATSLNNLAEIFRAVGDYVAAHPLYERALAIQEQALGSSHPSTATSLNNLAELLRAMGDYGAAHPLYERALAIREQRLGPDHPDTQSSRQSLAVIEQRLAGNESPPSAESQIAQLTQQAESAVAQALAEGSAEQRAALAKQLEDVAQQAEAGEQEGSPWLALAAHLRALAAQLRQAADQ
jgi:tetratricopeptide (TPR) repeat protein